VNEGNENFILPFPNNQKVIVFDPHHIGYTPDFFSAFSDDRAADDLERIIIIFF